MSGAGIEEGSLIIILQLVREIPGHLLELRTVEVLGHLNLVHRHGIRLDLGWTQLSEGSEALDEVDEKIC